MGGRRRRRCCRERPVLLTARLWTDKWEERQSPSSSGHPGYGTLADSQLAAPAERDFAVCPRMARANPTLEVQDRQAPLSHRAVPTSATTSDWMLFQLSLWAPLPSQIYPLCTTNLPSYCEVKKTLTVTCHWDRQPHITAKGNSSKQRSLCSCMLGTVPEISQAPRGRQPQIHMPGQS